MASFDEYLNFEENILALSPASECENSDNLFALGNVSDFLVDKSSDTKSPNSDFMSNGSDVDIDGFDNSEEESSIDNLFRVAENSPGENELIDYLTKNSDDNNCLRKLTTRNRNSNECLNLPKSVGAKPVYAFKQVKCGPNNPIQIKVFEGKPILRDGKHSVIKISHQKQGGRNGVNPPIKNSSNISTIGDKFSFNDVENKSCSKSAIAARENRERKKKYVADLEQCVKVYSSENKSLRKQVVNYEKVTLSLQNEVDYLKSVLANQSILSNLIKNIPDIKSVRLSTSEFTNMNLKRKSDDESSSEVGDSKTSEAKRIKLIDHDYSSNCFSQFVSGSKKKADETLKQSGGVCLHVCSSGASLEFCSQCSSQAAAHS